MILHFVRIALRRIWYNRGLTLLKVGGLGLSMAASIWLVRYVNFHWQFDRFHEHAEEIYRLNHHQLTEQQEEQRSAMTVAGSAVALKEQFPEVLDYVRLGRWIANDVVFQRGDKAIRDKDFFFVDPSFFEVFSFEWIAGDPRTGLGAPNTLFLSEQHAQALFGTEDPLGQEVVFEGRRNFTIAGVFRQPPTQSHFQFGLLSSISTVQQMGLDIYKDDHWEYPYVYAYVRIRTGADLASMMSVFNEQVNVQHGGPEQVHQFQLQALTDIHLYGDRQFELGASGNGKSLWILLGMALLIQLLAWINFFNIYTAASLAHLKNLGVRKVIGANRKQVAGQLVIESLILAGLGLGIGLLLAFLGEDFMASYFPDTATKLSWSDLRFGRPAFYLLFISLVGVVMSMGIPAWLLSSFQPAFAIGQKVRLPGLGAKLQKGLTTLQFAIIIGLLAGTLVVYQQTVFMLDKDTGLALDDKLVLLAPLGTKHYENLQPHFQQFKYEMEALPEVEQLTLTREIPGNPLEVLQGVEIEGQTKSTIFARYTVEPGFFKAFEISRVAGIDPESRPADEPNIAINESAMRLLGYQDPEQILNKTITYFEDDHRVVAVMKDHHHRSLHHDLLPIIYDFFSHPSEDGYITLNMSRRPSDEFLSTTQNAYQEAFPNSVFEHLELKAHYEEQYQGDLDFRRLGLAFTLLGFVVAALGLFGLSLLVFEKRTKEVGIRKVLGASVASIITLLVKDLLFWVLLGGLIALPLSWYLMDQWLDNFPYRVEPNWWLFAWSGLSAILMAFLTMSYQSWRTANKNPAIVLKQE